MFSDERKELNNIDVVGKDIAGGKGGLEFIPGTGGYGEGGE